MNIRLESHKMGVPFWTPTWNLKNEGARHLRGPILDPFLGETCLGILLGPTKSRSRLVFFGSKGLQGHSKRQKGGVQQPTRTEDAI